MLADRQALIGRVDSSELPTFELEQAAFDAWLTSEPAPRAELSVEQIEKLEELRALGVA